ncbi:beta lactamase domain, putative [Entamoeba invadens IP1]|uniref:Beta lactamase domain, putative n=1 Tax=Entamoeba invadens IP1 TaxID=370355 RepID=A0A0A1U4H0_ENTIV|nr:beta lactamase domain, putative [Entamoeba invadens IP1]ELP87761.1 beta lactamase domain, putative [Entamoeba invadens IP1]|eukprot:XP_004254532.1 beta lactamase domain, putative [Entamoeba invadens IP1]
MKPVQNNGMVYCFMPTGCIQTNTPIIGNVQTGNYILCDVGGDAECVIKRAKAIGLTNCIAVFFTHGHYDHIAGAHDIKKLTNAPLCINRNDEYLYNQVEMQRKSFTLPEVEQPPQIDFLMNEGDSINIDGIVGVLIHTPGHSPGSSCLYFHQQNLLVTGDTLFEGSCGRTDLWDGNARLMKDSIINKLFTLPKETIVIPGHGSRTTTIGKESKSNLISSVA